ncbi:class I SAM-dependent methyltransferase [Streptosporangium sp. G11]|uniref:class I SAM-dependent methyltransferase n=1 Tax=Streptosporangium sp. G11 TaxID=3436926 RepID=UPI003EBB0CE6
MKDTEDTKEQTWERRGNSFGSAAETYDRTRPDYPPEAVQWILGDRPRSVIDLGAGTGILTRRLIACGHDAVAVEPDDGMRARLAESTPGATVLAGRAESIPIADLSVDAVLVGHAYHWFAPEPAHAEIARVLRPGGVLAALWNLRDEDVPWSAELSGILGDEDSGVDRDTAAAVMLHGALAAMRGDGTGLSGWLRNPSFGNDFGAIERGFFANSTEHTVDTLIDLVRSRSYYLTATPERREELENRLRHLAATHPDLAGRETFTLPYITVVFRAIRRAPTER